MAGFSAFGRRRMIASGAIILMSCINTALSAQVNQFQEFFYVADKFPLVMSIITFVSYTILFAVNFATENSFVTRAPFLLGWELVLSIFWLAFNCFSTSRWRHVPLQCELIPSGFSDEKWWCRDLQALKSFVWIEWLLLVLAFAFTAHYVLTQARHGHPHVWSVSLARYDGTQTHASALFIQYPTEAYPTVKSVGGAAMRQYQAGGAGDYGYLERQQQQQQGWVGFGGEAQARDSVANGPGIAGVGARVPRAGA